MKLSVFILFIGAAIAGYNFDDDVYGLSYTHKCIMELATGPCRAALPRWGYDVTINKCVEFVYGGCDGNANRFKTREDCDRVCLYPYSQHHYKLLNHLYAF